MKKRILAVLAMLIALSASSVMAAGIQYLVFNLNEGSQQVVIPLSDQPVITMANGVLKVTVGGEVKVEQSFTEIKSYGFSENPDGTGIDAVLKDNVRFEQGHIYMANVNKGERISVYTTDGRLVATVTADDKGIADVDLSGLRKAVYVVKSANSSIKIIN
jgi:lipopolysaccharide export system protein LptA